MEYDKVELRLTYTKIVTLDTLPDDYYLQMSPGIFQEKIEKSFELRITVMNDIAIAVKINSQLHENGQLDWRYIPTCELLIEEFELPKQTVLFDLNKYEIKGEQNILTDEVRNHFRKRGIKFKPIHWRYKADRGFYND